MNEQASLFDAAPMATMASLRGRVTQLECVLAALPQAREHIGLDYCRAATGRGSCDCGHEAICRALEQGALR